MYHWKCLHMHMAVPVLLQEAQASLEILMVRPAIFKAYLLLNSNLLCNSNAFERREPIWLQSVQSKFFANGSQSWRKKKPAPRRFVVVSKISAFLNLRKLSLLLEIIAFDISDITPCDIACRGMYTGGVLEILAFYVSLLQLRVSSRCKSYYNSTCFIIIMDRPSKQRNNIRDVRSATHNPYSQIFPVQEFRFNNQTLLLEYTQPKTPSKKTLPLLYNLAQILVRILTF